MYHSAYIGSADDRDNMVNTWDTWHLVPTGRLVVAPPEVKTEYVEIPGMNGTLDYSEVLTGAPVYKDRAGSWEFYVMNDYQEWYKLYNTLLAYLHGKEFDVILEDEPDYTYHGRLSLNEWRSESGETWSKVVIDYVFSPYKQRSSTAVEEWKWDDLTCLRPYPSEGINTNGYIIYYGTFDVDDERLRTLYNPTDEDIEISMTVTSETKVSWYGKTKSFLPGDHEHTGIFIEPGVTEMVFTCAGRVIISYDRGEAGIL